MTASTLVPVEEYLKTMYHPDMDFVDGCLEERNMGEKEHGKLQFRVVVLLKRAKFAAFIETRLRVSAARYRIPDICAFEREPDEPVFTQPPLLCVEVLSPEDRLNRMMRVVNDYIGMGVPDVWLLDPMEKEAYIAKNGGIHPVKDGELTAAGGRIALPLEEVFSTADLF